MKDQIDSLIYIYIVIYQIFPRDSRSVLFIAMNQKTTKFDTVLRDYTDRVNLMNIACAINCHPKAHHRSNQDS